jgi:hypothetical protein
MQIDAKSIEILLITFIICNYGVKEKTKPTPKRHKSKEKKHLCIILRMGP